MSITKGALFGTGLLALSLLTVPTEASAGPLILNIKKKAVPSRAAPELSAGAAAAPLSLLVGGIAVVLGRRRRREK